MSTSGAAFVPTEETVVIRTKRHKSLHMDLSYVGSTVYIKVRSIGKDGSVGIISAEVSAAPALDVSDIAPPVWDTGSANLQYTDIRQPARGWRCKF